MKRIFFQWDTCSSDNCIRGGIFSLSRLPLTSCCFKWTGSECKYLQWTQTAKYTFTGLLTFPYIIPNFKKVSSVHTVYVRTPKFPVKMEQWRQNQHTRKWILKQDLLLMKSHINKITQTIQEHSCPLLKGDKQRPYVKAWMQSLFDQ